MVLLSDHRSTLLHALAASQQSSPPLPGCHWTGCIHVVPLSLNQKGWLGWCSSKMGLPLGAAVFQPAPLALGGPCRGRRLGSPKVPSVQVSASQFSEDMAAK